jgi:phosphoglycolate phosphatase
MQYDAIIFDIDGTLWNACATSAKGMNRTLENLKIPKVLTTQDIENISGKPSDQVLPILFGELLDQHPDLIERIDEGERQAIEEEGGLIFDGVIKGIQELSQVSKVFLVSNCDDWYLEAFIKFAGLSKYISGANCYGLSGITKANMITNILKNNNAQHAVYIGDTLSDQKAAALANINFIGATYGFGNVSTAQKSFDSFAEIVENLLRA